MHRQAFRFIESQMADIDASEMDVIECGSLIVNGSVRPLFPVTRSYTGVDLREGDGVDVVADAADYQPPAPVDLVVSTEMLEHAPRQAEVIANIARMLKPGGRLLLTAAGVGRHPHTNDGDSVVPEDEFYNNVSEEALTEWLTAAGFASFEISNVLSHSAENGDIYVNAVMPVAVAPATPPITPTPKRRSR